MSSFELCRHLVAGFMAFILFSHSVASADQLANDRCPVMTDSPALADFSTEYKGKQINFCCTECIKEFHSNPDKYTVNVPQLANVTAWEEVGHFLRDEATVLAGVGLSILLIVLRVVRMRRGKSERAPSKFEQMISRQISPTIPLVIVAGILSWQLYSLYWELFFVRMEQDIHYATFYDYGYPPVPDKMNEGNRLAGTYYRGNDERNPALFNNGNYRTAVFRVSLVTADAEHVDDDEPIGGQDLFVRLEIDRPPFTPNYLYSERFIGATFLTQQCDPFLGYDGPVADRVNLTETEPMQKWEARFPIGAAPKFGSETREGIVYVCEEYYYQPHRFAGKTSRGGARFHYGIPYKLQFHDGRLTPDSDLYMGSLYRTRKFPRRTVPFEQWFSHQPIPELPGKGTDDPHLLGIDDYER